jgi:predicted Zn-dependent protease with MMP-like domain
MSEPRPKQAAWSAPTLADIERIADHAFARLPAQFRQLCAGLVIRVEDFPSEDVLREMECESEFDLLGHFQGHGLAQQGAGPFSGQMPNMVFLYRRPILDYWVEHEETLGDLVTHVLIHEIGHHFGLSDADMAAIEAAAG